MKNSKKTVIQGIRVIGRATISLICLPLSASAQIVYSGDGPFQNVATTPVPAIDASAPFTPTVNRLLEQMSINEKIAMSHIIADPDSSKIGSVGYFPGVPRLGIPARRDVDALGIQVIQDATALPSRIGWAASFDRAAVYAAGQLVGAEGRALGVDLVYAPQVDLARIPNWGRNNATFGEDPFLSGQLGIQDIGGIQSQGLMSQVKHLAFYHGQAGSFYAIPGNPELPSVIDEQTAQELYLKPFEYSLREAIPSSVMASYQGSYVTPQQKSGLWATENPYLLKTVLRDQWGFIGFTESDYGATHNIEALLAGLDQDSGPEKNYFAEKLKPLVDPLSKSYDARYAKALDTAVTRVLYQYERFGLLLSQDSSSVVKHPNMASLKGHHMRITERLSEQGAVLLKNENAALPLTPADLESVAVIGPTAAQIMVDGGQPERARGFPDRVMISTFQMLQRLAPQSSKFTYSAGIDWIGSQVPESAFSGLVRTETGSNTQRKESTINYDAHTAQNDLTPGKSYTWTGTLTVPEDDTYYLWIQRNWLDWVFSERRTVKLTVDGIKQHIVAPGVPVATYPAGVVPPNGTNEGVPLKLSSGKHNIVVEADIPKSGYYPIDATSPIPVMTPVTFRITWSRLSKTIASAVEVAKAAKTVVLFLDDNGLPEDEVGIQSSRIVEGLAPNQEELIYAITNANPRTIVVMSTGNPVLMPWIDKVRAVLETWYPGQEGATATAKLLLGLANPSGKTPMSWPANEEQTPFANHSERIRGDGHSVNFSEGLLIGYRWYDSKKLAPLFPFGHGLSYTTFTYSNLSYAPDTAGLEISFTLKNSGKVAGAEAPQVYIGAPEVPKGVQVVPQKLVAFDRVELAPGQEKRLTLHISKRELSYWSTKNGYWILPSGDRELAVGSSSRDIRLSMQVRIK